MSLHTPDLTKYPPRSPRVRLGGYVDPASLLDKGRATLAGKNGEYHYACPIDQRFLKFVGIDPEELKKQLNKSDAEVLAWVEKNAKHKPPLRKSWLGPIGRKTACAGQTESREYFNELHKKGRAQTRGYRDMV